MLEKRAVAAVLVVVVRRVQPLAVAVADALEGAVRARRAGPPRLREEGAHGLARRHVLERVLANVSAAVLVERVEVARVDVPVALHHELRGAAAEHPAGLGVLPQGELHDVVKEPHRDDVAGLDLAQPQVEERAVEREERPGRERVLRALAVKAGEARDELHVVDLLALVELEDPLGVPGELRGEHREDVEVHASLAQHAHGLHHAGVRGAKGDVLAQAVVQLAVGVHGDPHEKRVLAEELGPLGGDRVGVGLERVAHVLVGATLVHVAREAPEEVQPRERGLPALEGKGHLRVVPQGKRPVHERADGLRAHPLPHRVRAVVRNVAVEAV